MISMISALWWWNSSTLGVFGVGVWSFEAVIVMTVSCFDDIWRHNEILWRHSMFSHVLACSRDDSERKMTTSASVSTCRERAQRAKREKKMTSFWAVLTIIWRHNEPLCRFSMLWTCYRDDSERNKMFLQHPLLSLTAKIARSATCDPLSMLEHAYMTISAVRMSHYAVFACYKWRFLTNFERHLLKTAEFNFALFLTCSAYDRPLSNEPFSMSLSAIGDPQGQLMC